jgi:non-specific serine/threonine protein kinase
LPLAIELAAARVKLLAPPDLLSRLERRLSLLTGGALDAPMRQQTLRAAITWSYELLSRRQQLVLSRFAVFDGGWTIAAAEAVVPGDGEGLDVLEALDVLVNHSLVLQSDLAHDGRFTMLETVAEFASELLAASGEEHELRQRHACWYLAFAEALDQRPDILRPSVSAAVTRELANLRSALEWFADSDQPVAFARLAGGLGWYWFHHGHFTEGRERLEQAVAGVQDGPATVRARALLYAGVFASRHDEQELALRYLAECLEIARTQDDAPLLGSALLMRGQVEADLSLLEEAAATLTEAAAVFNRCKLENLEAGATLELAFVAFHAGDLAAARAHSEHAIELSQRAGYESSMVASAFESSAVIAWAAGDHERALEHVLYGLDMSRRIDNPHPIVQQLALLAHAAAEHGHPDRAARLWGSVDHMCERMNAMLLQPQRAYRLQATTSLSAQLGHDRLQAELQAGQLLSIDDSIAFAHETVSVLRASDTGTKTPSAGGPGGLTARELDVLRLIVDGKPDREIAATLFISPRTVTTHVTNILNKLGVSSRAAAAAYAVRHELV